MELRKELHHFEGIKYQNYLYQSNLIRFSLNVKILLAIKSVYSIRKYEDKFFMIMNKVN